MYKKILVPLDGSSLAETAIPHVEAIASGCHVTDVVVIQVIERRVAIPSKGRFMPTEKDLQNIEEEMRKEAREYLNLVQKRLKDSGITAQTDVLVGKAAETIGEYAEKNNVDLIVMTTHGFSGITRWAMGSTADRLVHTACVPVLLVRPPQCVPHK